MNISAEKRAVAEYAITKTSTLQISVIKDDFIKHTVNKNSAIKERIIKFSIFPLLMFNEFKAEVAMRC